MATSEPLFPELDFAAAELADLHEVLDEARRHGPVVPVRFHGDTAWLVNAFTTLRAAFRDEERFPSAAFYRRAQEPAMGRTMQAMTGDEHRRHRALAQDPFLPQRVRESAGRVVEDAAASLIEALPERGDVDLVRDFTRLLPFRVITRLLGVPGDDEERMLAWVDKLFSYPWDPDGALRARTEVEDYFRPAIERRRREPGDDLISLLATAELEGRRLGEEEILPFCLLLFPAGSDTTYKNLGSLVHMLLSLPEARARVLEGEEARRGIIEEGLRMEPPVALLPRTCGRDTELGGVPLAEGTPMLFGIAAANRDPEVFPEPHRFDPARSQRTLTFGQGVHVCLGQHLARMELDVAIRRLFERYPRMAFAADPPPITGGVLRGPRSLPVRLDG